MPEATVGELNETRVLTRILEVLGPSRALIGPGDDAAVLAVPDGRIVASVDTLVHGPDFRLAWTDGYALGWKAAAVNLADIAAMGARPTALLVALAMPEHTTVTFVEQLARGLREACDALAPGCAVEGGDLTVSDTLTVAVTALGSLEGRAPVTRAGARAGDAIAIAGTLGAAGRGLALLFDRFRDEAGAPIPVDLSALADLERADLEAQLRPRPPVLLGIEAARAGARAMMDVSDGLVLDASRLAAASAVGIDLDAEALGSDLEHALTGGEDHALLAVFPEGADLPSGFRRIGTVTGDTEVRVRIDGEPFGGVGGWDPYRDWDAARG